MSDADLIYTATAPFEAARVLRSPPAAHALHRRHGHSFLATAHARLAPAWAPFAGAEVGALAAALAAAVEPLDYRDLNDILPEPTDASLAAYLRERLAVPRIARMAVRSAPCRGALIDESGAFQHWRRYALQSAHWLPNVPPGHKCGRLHGHGFEVLLHASPVDGVSTSPVETDRLDAAWAPLHAELDHACLNDVPGLEVPTSELLAEWIWHRLKSTLPQLASVTVLETGSCGAHYDGARFRIWKEFTLDSALHLPLAPPGDPRRRMHGHTYQLRLHLDAPLDRVVGWTKDFGEVKPLFDPVFARLDHQPLHALPELAQADTANLACWIRHATHDALPELARIDLHEIRGCGVTLDWGGRHFAPPL